MMNGYPFGAAYYDNKTVTSNTYEARTDRPSTAALNVARSGGAGTVSYGYNVRGWLTGITAKAFTEELHYAGTEVNPEPCYNGNVSGVLWTTCCGPTPTTGPCADTGTLTTG